jgi:hypothetical protein
MRKSVLITSDLSIEVKINTTHGHATDNASRYTENYNAPLKLSGSIVNHIYLAILILFRFNLEIRNQTRTLFLT